jgi:hypothetical protein
MFVMIAHHVEYSEIADHGHYDRYDLFEKPRIFTTLALLILRPMNYGVLDGSVAQCSGYAT